MPQKEKCVTRLLAGSKSNREIEAEEQAELEALVRANALLGVLKAEARLFLKPFPAA